MGASKDWNSLYNNFLDVRDKNLSDEQMAAAFGVKLSTIQTFKRLYNHENDVKACENLLELIERENSFFTSSTYPEPKAYKVIYGGKRYLDITEFLI